VIFNKRVVFIVKSNYLFLQGLLKCISQVLFIISIVYHKFCLSQALFITSFVYHKHCLSQTLFIISTQSDWPEELKVLFDKSEAILSDGVETQGEECFDKNNINKN